MDAFKRLQFCTEVSPAKQPPDRGDSVYVSTMLRTGVLLKICEVEYVHL